MNFHSRVNSFAQIYLVILAIISLSHLRITIYEPKALKFLYFGQQIKYSVMNFGKIPYGYSVTGLVYKGEPADGCTPLKPIEFDKNQNQLIVLLERGVCNFAEKVLNAQNIGASLVFIVDNASENVHKIFPVERTKTVLDQLRIPSLLVSKIDGDQLRTAIEMQAAHSESESPS